MPIWYLVNCYWIMARNEGILETWWFPQSHLGKKAQIPLLRFQNLRVLFCFGDFTSIWMRNMFPELYIQDLNETLCLIPALCFCLINSDSLCSRRKLAFGIDLLKIKIQHYFLLFSAFLCNNTLRGVSIEHSLLSSS